MTGRTKEKMIAQNKRARTRAGSLAIVTIIVDQPKVARACILPADVVLSFSGVFCFLFRFRLYAFIESEALRSIVLRHICAPAAIRS